MTHGDIWLPIFGTNNMLYCEAWSDGYIRGVGLGVLSSSQKIQEISELSAMFAGSPFFYEISTNSYVAKEGDDLIEVFRDNVAQEDQQWVDEAEKAFELVLQGDLEKARENKFAQLSLEDKLSKEFGANALIKNQEQVFEILKPTHTIKEEDLYQLIALHKDKKSIRYNYTYVWKDEQFVSTIEIDKVKYICPLIVICALECGKDNTYGDSAYLSNMTQKDKQSIMKFIKVWSDNENPIEKLWEGQLITFAEKHKLEEAIDSLPKNKPSKV